jgi:hypothetical protein
MKTKQILTNIALLTLFSSISMAATPLGTAFTYQGRLSDGTNLANGSFDLRFSLYDAASHGALVVPPLTNRPVAVSDGIFMVALDFGANVFNGSARWLELGVRTNGSAAAYDVLSPRQQVTPTPYSLYAANAALLNGQSTSSFAPAAGSANYVAKAGDTMTGTLRLPLNGLIAGTDQLVLSAGKVGIRTANPQATFDVNGGIRAQNGLSAAGNLFFTGTSAGAQQGTYLTWNTQMPKYGMSELVNNRGSGPGGFGFYNTGDGTTMDRLMYLESNGALTVDGTVQAAGLTIVGPLHFLGTSAGVGDGTYLTWNTQMPNYGMTELVNNRGTGPGGFGFYNTADGTTLTPLMSLDGKGALAVNGTVQAAGLSTVGPLYFRGTSAGGADGTYLTWNTQIPNTGMTEFVNNRGLGAGGFGFYNTADGTTMTPLMTVQGDGNVGIGTNTPEAKLHVNGTARVCVLEITGGCDLAEPFEMSAKDIPQGAVVVIDNKNPGRLKMSEQAYDHRVAGIISGANGISPGLTLSQQGIVEGGQNVALSGRVYVLADASNGPIEPGDLLTTSEVPGHAMKVTEHAQAQGAILGKAMSGLEEGKGMVLVLVTLQ